MRGWLGGIVNGGLRYVEAYYIAQLVYLPQLGYRGYVWVREGLKRMGGPKPPLPVYRGTNRVMETAVFRESGYVLSDAAIANYVETENVALALKHADDVHGEWLKIFGDLSKYAEAHAAHGIELESMYGLKRTLVSVTTDASRAVYYAGDGGIILRGQLEYTQLIRQTLETSTEQEYLIIGGSNLLKKVPNP